MNAYERLKTVRASDRKMGSDYVNTMFTADSARTPP